MSYRIHKILITCCFFTCYVLMNAQYNYSSESQNTTYEYLPSGKKIRVTTIKKSSNGKSSQRCLVNNIDVDCNTLNKCLNSKECDEIEKLIAQKGNASQNNNSTNQSNDKNTSNKKNLNLFAEIKLTKTKAYLGENILATYKIYTRYNRMQIIDYDFPMTNGLWTEELKSGGNGWPQKQEVRNGMLYNVLTLKKEIISPQKSGKITIAPIEIKALFNQSFFNPGTEYSFKSNSVTIQVKSFPKGAPASFSDQVGKNYKLKVKYSTKELKVDDPLDISISISGNGNLKQLVIPELKYPKDLDIFPVEAKEEFKINTSGVFGKKTHHQLLIPRHHGTYTIPEIIFTYFDLKSKKYKTLKYPSQEIIVEKNNSGTSSNTNSTIINQEDVRLMNESIRYIETESNIYAKKPTLYGTKKYWAFLASPGFLFFLFIFLYNYKKRNSNPDKIAQKKAGRKLEKKFSLAGSLLANQQIDEFYEELYKAWLQYISIKFNLPFSKLNKESIKNVCVKYQISEEDAHSLENILDQCEKAKYAPLDAEDSKAVLQKSKIIIQKIERHAKV